MRVGAGIVSSGIVIVFLLGVITNPVFAVDMIDFDMAYYYTNGTRSAVITYVPDVACSGTDTVDVVLTSSSDSETAVATCAGGNYFTGPILITSDSLAPEPKLLVQDGETITVEKSPVGSGITSTASIITDYVCCSEFQTSEPLQPDYTQILTCPDADGDRLCNIWERSSGLRISANGVTYKYLCGNYGPDPDCPHYSVKWDVYVETDWLAGHAPDQEALNIVKDKFANNGVSAKPVIIHFQLDEQLPKHYSQIGTQIGGQDASEYTKLKRHHFGTEDDRNAGSGNFNNYLTNKRNAFHYMLIGSKDTGSSSSGKAEITANDMAITLGYKYKGVGSTDDQAATIMHEVGHNLGLDHGGNVATNCKPNYLSVMNHLYQFPILIDRVLDFSSGSGIIDLEEGNLDDVAGIGTSGAGKQIVWNNGTTITTTIPSTNEVDWNQDAQLNTAALDLNKISSIATCDGSGTSLMAFNDWNGLQFDFTGHSGFLDAQNDKPITIDALSKAPKEIGANDINQMWTERVGNIGTFSESDYTKMIKSIRSEDFASFTDSDSGDTIDISNLESSLEKLTRMGMKAKGTFEKYYDENDIIIPPKKQKDKELKYNEIICKQSHEKIFVNLDDETNPTTAETVCIKSKSFKLVLEHWKDIIVGGNYLCDINDSIRYENKLDLVASDTTLSQITNSTFLDGDGNPLDCKSYSAQFE